MKLRILHLYRPRLPSTRAQDIQVLGTCWGLARAGAEVTLLADAPRANMPREELPTIEDVLRFYDLPPVEGLDLKLSPVSHPGLASFWFRKHVLLWVLESERFHKQRSVILARAKRYFDEYTLLPFGPPVVMEAHEVESASAKERGADPKELAQWLALERRLLEAASGLVTNCGGTLKLLQDTHGSAIPPNTAVVHNATNARRVRNHFPGAEVVVGYAGSLRIYKGMTTLREAAELLPEGVTLELLGGSPEEIEALQPLPDNVRALGDLPYREVPDRVRRWHAALLPLDADVFGMWLCNPMKLWDYLAIGVPLVAADLPTLREALGQTRAVSWYSPGDAASLAAAVEKALRPSTRRVRRRRLRSWTTRGAELLPVLTKALS